MRQSPVRALDVLVESSMRPAVNGRAAYVKQPAIWT